MVTASDDTTARIWNAATGAEIAVLKGHSEGLRTAVFSPDGKRVVTACAAQTARVWDAATGAEIVVLRGHEQRASCAHWPGVGNSRPARLANANPWRFAMTNYHPTLRCCPCVKSRRLVSRRTRNARIALFRLRQELCPEPPIASKILAVSGPEFLPSRG